MVDAFIYDGFGRVIYAEEVFSKVLVLVIELLYFSLL